MHDRVHLNAFCLADKITLEVLEKELSFVKQKWYQIGLFLKIDETRLAKIKKGKFDKQRLRDVLSAYMLAEKCPSWTTIVDCLKSAEVGCVKVAEKIEKKHLTPSIKGKIWHART